MALVFFLGKNVSPEKAAALEEEIRNSSFVDRTNTISSEEALKKFKERFPELQDILENLGVNPFPPSIEAILKNDGFSSSEVNGFLAEMKKKPEIEDAQFNQNWVERMHSLSRLVSAVGFFFGGILLLASFFIISNVIRLNVFARKDEIEILRLVGATNQFIRCPFLLEGTLLGILGGFFSLVLLLPLIEVFPLYVGSSLGVFNELIQFRYLSLRQILLILFSGAFIGFVGSLTSLSRFLKA